MVGNDRTVPDSWRSASLIVICGITITVFIDLALIIRMKRETEEDGRILDALGTKKAGKTVTAQIEELSEKMSGQMKDVRMLAEEASRLRREFREIKDIAVDRSIGIRNTTGYTRR
jgi:predicted DNA-binding protein